MAKLKLEITGEETLINQTLDSFCRAFGWTESHELNQLEFGAKQLKTYFYETVKDYQVRQAALQVQQTVAQQLQQVNDNVSITAQLE